MSLIRPVLLAASLMFTGALVACNEGNGAASSGASAETPAWLLATEPEGARDVAVVKAEAGEGDEVVLRGRIGGRMEPMSEGSPVFMLMDLGLPSCADNPEDACPTPWDYCCETLETITANAATVQIVDAQGRPVADSPVEHGFKNLDEIIVVGTVAPRPDDRVLTIRASQVYRGP